jgi:hypothetical protein
MLGPRLDRFPQPDRAGAARQRRDGGGGEAAPDDEAEDLLMAPPRGLVDRELLARADAGTVLAGGRALGRKHCAAAAPAAALGRVRRPGRGPGLGRRLLPLPWARRPVTEAAVADCILPIERVVDSRRVRARARMRAVRLPARVAAAVGAGGAGVEERVV